MALWDVIPKTATVLGRQRAVRLADLANVSCLGGQLEALRGRSVVLAVADQLTAAITQVELDGVAQRMVLCPPGLAADHVSHVIRSAEADVWVGDRDDGDTAASLGVALCVRAQPLPVRARVTRQATCETEWVLLTSGTTGAPKLVVHTLATLTSAFAGRAPEWTPPVIWSTFYDIRRYGGLQIYLRALFDGSLVLTHPGERAGEFLQRAIAAGVTHISGTPSHWRKALMCAAIGGFSPRYVRLSGEIADQGILDALRRAFPSATIAHAFASTEAGVGFEVRDGFAGFPASLAGTQTGGCEIDTSRGTLRIRSPGNALRYLGPEDQAPPVKDTQGFVDMGDNLNLCDGRCYFVGRNGGIINVGGLKVHPEEVEAVINTHPAVSMSLIKARKNPITGSVVVAEVVLTDPPVGTGPVPAGRVREEILAMCRSRLPAHKVPAAIRVVPRLEVSASGKLVRPDA